MTGVHSGEFGDIVVSLPVIKHMGGGVLYLRNAPFTRARMTWEYAQAIVPLLKAQPYIKDVLEWKGENCDVDLDNFRGPYFKALRKDINRYRHTALWWWYSQVFGVPESAWQTPWLEVVPETILDTTVIANRTWRYQNPSFDWKRIVEKYHPIRFGVVQEENTIPGYGSFVNLQDLLMVAKAIAGARLFVGNQSCLYHIAEGLKKPSILEEFQWMPNCRYPARCHQWFGDGFLPDLKDLP